MPRAEDLDSERLATLVSLNHFEAALRYHGHLVAASVPIPPDRVYAKAALAALERSSQPDRINVFSTWFRLVPDADPSLDLRPIRAALLETGTPATNLSLIARFAVLAAEKGYSQRVWPDVLQLLITHSTLAFATRLMVEHEFAAVSYVLKAGSGREPEVRGRLRDQSVRACIKADWPEAAAALLLTAEGLYVPTRLHGAVIAMLEERGAPMEKLDQLRVARDASARYRRFEGRIALPGDLLMQLREVRTAIRARILDKYLDVPDFLVAYDKMKPNQRVLQILKSRALMRSDETARSWLNAEFFLLRHKNHGNRSLTLFVSNFTLEGFSSDAQALITGIADMRHVGPVSPRVPKPMVLPSHLQWYVWHALVLCSSRRTDLHQRLFDAYVDAANRVTPEALVAGGARQVLKAFMSAFARFGQPGDLQRVWDVMDHLGIQPARGHYELLARTLAQSGDIDGALRVLQNTPRPASYAMVIAGLLDQEMVGAAQSVAMAMKMRLGKEVSEDNSLIDARLGATMKELDQQTEKALEVFTAERVRALEASGMQPTPADIELLATSAARVGRVDGAIRMLEKTTDAHTHCVVVEELLKAGMTDAAIRVGEMMQRRRIQQETPEDRSTMLRLNRLRHQLYTGERGLPSAT